MPKKALFCEDERKNFVESIARYSLISVYIGNLSYFRPYFSVLFS